MFTVEMEEDETIVTTLDETGRFEDVTILMDSSDHFFIRQWCEALDKYELIELSGQQLRDLVASMNTPVGAFYVKGK